MLERRFIESVNFPFSEVSEASGIEKGPGRPPHWEMVFWWTRKPLISARAIIAGCLLPEKTNPANFLRSIGIVVRKRRPDGRPVFERSPHRVKPRLRFDGVKILDPFACFGSIPLEGLRLGLSATACDLLPVGYVFLKAVLEYPARYGAKLVKDVEKWGNWVTERLKEDPLMKELYDKDVAVYIGSWEVKCPSCGNWTPLVGNWWLARVKGKNGYKRLAWMEKKAVGDKVEINTVDLNETLGNSAVMEADVKDLKVSIKGEDFRVPEANIEAKREQSTCLHCDQPIGHIDLETEKHIMKTKGMAKEIGRKLVWYVKYALGKYHEGDSSLARLRLLVKVKLKDSDLEFVSCTEEDQKKLEEARANVEKLSQQKDPDIPMEPISPYSVRYLFPLLYGKTEWHKLFNPRQLLTLVKLTKLIRDTGKLIERQKIKEGSSREDAFNYAEAVTTYLAIAFCKHADFSSLCSAWQLSYLIAAHTLAMRGIAMIWNYGDINPYVDFTGSYKRTLRNTSRGLSYLVSAMGDVSSRVGVLLDDVTELNIQETKVLLDDATMLNKLEADERFDIIVTDPPYYDDVPYTELSDFYCVWLKRALSDINRDKRLKPRFLKEAFFEKIGDDWVEVSTQWENYALSEVSLNPPRLGSNVTTANGVRHFQNLLNSSFIMMTSKLKDDGSLVTYYAHTSPNAWKALLGAGWEAAGLRVTNAFPIATESAQSVVSRGKLSMDTSIVVAWRGVSEGSIDASDLYGEMVEEAANRARELMNLDAIGRDLFIGTLAAALASATKYREVRVMGRIDVGALVDKYVYPATYLGLAKALARRAELEDGVRSPEAMFYLLVKSTLAGAKKKTLESTDVRIFSIGTSLDLNTALRTWRVLRAGEKEAGAKVAKAKTLTLVEPTSADRSKLAELLEARNVGTRDPRVRCSVDALHVLEYFAVVHPREEFRRKLEELKASCPAHAEEALSMARIMAKVLPEEDVERSLCSRIVEHLEPNTPKMGKFASQEVK